jgi:hypothetical protein
MALSALYFLVRARTAAAYLIAAGAFLSLLLGMANQYSMNRNSEAFNAGGEAALPESAMEVAWVLSYASMIPPLLIALGFVLLARTYVRR